MRRRDFITGVIFAVVAQRVRAQQPTKVYRLAWVIPAESVAVMTIAGSVAGTSRAFLIELQQRGFVEGQNLIIERYSGEGRTEHFAELAHEVIRSNPDVIFVGGSRLALDVKAGTDTIPIVAGVADPIAYGIAPSLARPGGNVTGIVYDPGIEIWGKRLELLHEMLPGVSRVAFLATPRVWKMAEGAAVRQAAEKMKISLVGPPLGAPLQETEYRQVFAAMTQVGAEALIVSDQNEHSRYSRLIVRLAAEARLPAIYGLPFFASIGGLMTYGVDEIEMVRHAADQVAEILGGAKPGDIPFYQPTKFTLTINLKTAKALGITVPPTLVIAASEVIE